MLKPQIRSTEAAAPPLLRDLDTAAFAETYACDRFTASILGNRFRYVNAHMATKLRSNAFSLVIRDMDDFCSTISGPPELGWAMPAASLTNPVHWGPVSDAVGLCLEEYGLETLGPGDLIVANDSYRTGKHVNDMSFIRPLFWEGRLIGAVHITAHQLDIGSRIAGGFDIASQTLWEDGLVLPPTLLYSRGVPVRSAFSLISANTRYPDLIVADLEVIRSALDLGETLLMESIRRYGIHAYLGAIRYACDAAAEGMDQAIQALPDGVYRGENRIDGDGLPDSPEYAIVVAITKAGKRLEFDFSGTTEASRTAVNCSWLDVKTGVIMALKMLLDRHSPPNSGAMRNVDIILPPGSMLNPHPPASTMFYFSMVQAIIRATIDALNPALHENAIAGDSGSTSIHRAHGRTAEGKPWGGPSLESGVANYSWGATRAGDGDAFSLLCWMNFPLSGLEIKELDAPIVVLRVEAAADSGGPGYHRGGAAQYADVHWLHAGHHHQYTSQIRQPAPGAFGGGPGRAGGDWIFDRTNTGIDGNGWLPAECDGPLYRRATAVAGMIDPETNGVSADGRYIFLREEVFASAGSIARGITNGGGGWGDAFAREPERVMRDVRDGYVSIAGAARDYGVVVIGDPDRDPEGLAIDRAATAALRAG